MINKTLLTIFLIIFSSLHVDAISSDITPPDFNFWLGTEGGEMTHTPIKGERYFLTATVDWNQEKHDYAEEYGESYGLDVYFGLKMPETGEIFTWYDNDNGNRELSEGYIPIIYNTLEGKITLETKPHTITSDDQKGMYRAFIILVKTGSNPSNPDNWHHTQGITFYYDENNGDTSGSAISSSPGVNPEEIADAVIIFTPAVDIDLLPSPDKREIIGEIVSTLKGNVDGKICMNPGSWIRSLKANEQVRISLIKHPEEDYYYPISIADVTK